LRADAYDEMIRVAESKFRIAIRKKSWRQTVVNLHAKEGGGYSVTVLCRLFGLNNEYLSVGIRVSMTESGDPKEKVQAACCSGEIKKEMDKLQAYRYKK
jgi:hypothetical protein